MVLAGLALAQALALFAAAGAVVVALYFLRLRRRAVPVPFLALWEELLGEPSATRLFSRLRHVLSLLLMLVVLALLVAALADPRRGVASSSLRHTLVLVDAGLTMQATDVAPSRLDAALDVARGVVSEAGASHRMLVAAVDATPVPLGALTDERDVLEASLAKIRATDRTTRAEPAYRFALQALRDRAGARVVVVSDRIERPAGELARAFERAGIEVVIARVGHADANFALSELALRRYPLDARRSELMLAVHNAGRAAGKVEVTLFGDGAPIAVESLDVGPGATERRFYEDLGGVARTIEARLRAPDGTDHLPADDRAYSVVPERRRARVLCVSEANRYLEAALLLDEYLDVDVVAPAEYAGAAGYDAAIFDRFVPPSAPEVDAVYLAPEPAADGAPRALPIETAGLVEAPSFERIDRGHPLVRWTALRDVNVARALALRPAPADTVVAADPRTPLLVVGARGERRFVVLGFDVRESDLPLRTAWPLLLLNAIDWLRRDATAFESAHAVGEPIRVTVPEGVGRVEAVRPDGTAGPLVVHDGSVVTSSPRAGFLRVAAAGTETVVAVTRDDDADGRIAPGSRDGAWTPGDDARRRADGGLPPWMLFVVVALGVLVAEWASYHRRWTL